MNHLAGNYAARLEATLQKFGLPSGFRTLHNQHRSKMISRNKTEVIISSIPGETDVPVLLLPIGSIGELREKAGTTGSTDDSHVHYPGPLPDELKAIAKNCTSRQNLLASLNQEHLSLLRKASIAYMTGKKEKVAEYEELINAAQFPGQVALVVAEEINYDQVERVVISGSDFVFFHCEKMVSNAPLTLDIHSDCILNIGSFGSEAPRGKMAESNAPTVINAVGQPYTEAAKTGENGKLGEPGGKGNNGTTQYNTGNCRTECNQPPTDGVKGSPGGKGDKGFLGLKGNPGPSTDVFLENIVGDLVINAGGGKGQTGGSGGKGGPGGPGGPPGDKPNECSTAAKKGEQGKGGQGGDANDGGPGGDPGSFTVYYKSVSGKITPNEIGGVGGDAGSPGKPGDGVGNNGEGLTANNGKNSKPSSIKVIQIK